MFAGEASGGVAAWLMVGTRSAVAFAVKRTRESYPKVWDALDKIGDDK